MERSAAEPDDLRAPRRGYAAVFAGLAVCLALLSLRRVAEGDPFCHLAVGRWIAAHGAVPRADLFMYTAPHSPWADHSWLFELLLFWVWRLAGIVGMQVMVLAAVLAVFGLLLRFWRQEGVSPVLAPLPFLLVIVLMAERFRARPELATYLLLVAALGLLFRWRERPTRAIWALPVMGVVWANLHGGMAAGLLICVLFTASEGLRTLAARRLAAPPALAPRQWGALALATAAMALSALANPYGFEWYQAVMAPDRLAFLQGFIEEWRPLFGPHGQVAAGVSLPVLVALLVLFVGSFAAGRRFDLTALVLAVASAAMAVRAQRNLALLGLVWLVVMALNLRGTRLPGGSRWARPAFAAAGVLLGLAVIGLALGIAPFSEMARMRRLGFGPDPKVLPVAAERWVRASRLPGRLFNEYRYGGYLVWTGPLPGGRPLFIDQLNAYGAATFEEYLEIRRANPRAPALLDRWQVNTCLLPDTPVTRLRRGGDLRVLLADSPQWDMVYRDHVAVVFVRVSPMGREANFPALPPR